LMKDVSVLGMGVSDLAGVGSGMTVGAHFLPAGQYIALAVLAGVDIVNGAIDAGKKSRNKPDDKWQVGDMVRGVVYTAKEFTRKGAVRRGKSYHEFYDNNDKVKVDPFDFAVGATEETGKYLDRNKARFVGATIGCVTTITLGVVVTPLVGILAGLVTGQITQFAVKKTEQVLRKKKYTNASQSGFETDSFFNLPEQTHHCGTRRTKRQRDFSCQ